MLHPALATYFGVDTVEKLAEAQAGWSPLKGGLPLAALVGGLLLARGMSKGVNQEVQDGNAVHNFKRMSEASRNAPINTTLRGGVPLDPRGSLIYDNERMDSAGPLDMSQFDKAAALEGIEAGRFLAKLAGIGGPIGGALGAINKAPDLLVSGAQKLLKPVVSRLPGPSLGTKAVIGAGALGAGMLAAKGGKKALAYGMTPPQEHRLGGHAAGLPTYVNQYGVPEMGGH